MSADDSAAFLRAPWTDPAFLYVAAALAVLLAITLAGVAFAAARRRGGAPPRTLFARWLTWAILAPLFAIVVFSGLIPIAILVTLFALQGLREWSTLLDLPRPHRALLATYAVLAGVLSLYGATALLATIPLLLLAGMLQPVLVADTRRGMRDLAFGALGFAYLPFLLAFAVLMARDIPAGAAILFVTGAAAGFSDIGAYIVGKAFGRHKLAPTLSPNKTVEGAVGNLAGASLAFVIFLPILPGLGPAAFAVLPIVVAVGAIWGDLFKSALKREVGVKDAGTLLPGFGGILDRIDSFIVAVPLVYYAVVLTGFLGLGAGLG